ENSIPQKQAVPGHCPGTGGWSFQGNLDVSHLHGGDLAHVQQMLEGATEGQREGKRLVGTAAGAAAESAP
ncbi:DNA binding domain, excisionase family, partial [Dysosmobacter welbionis]